VGLHTNGLLRARQLDAVPPRVGFAASGELLEHVSGLCLDVAMDLAVRVIGAGSRGVAFRAGSGGGPL
jgi:hypothetical protein